MPGVAAATIRSTCWSLKVQTSVKQQRHERSGSRRQSHLRGVSNRACEAVDTQDVMVAAQRDGEDHLKLCKLPQAAEDDVEAKG